MFRERLGRLLRRMGDRVHPGVRPWEPKGAHNGWSLYTVEDGASDALLDAGYVKTVEPDARRRLPGTIYWALNGYIEVKHFDKGEEGKARRYVRNRLGRSKRRVVMNEVQWFPDGTCGKRFHWCVPARVFGEIFAEETTRMKEE